MRRPSLKWTIWSANVGKAMKAGAFLGAYGLTQRDVKDHVQNMQTSFLNPVEKWPAVAATGELGAHRMM